MLSTGDELVGPGRPLGPGQIRDSNRVALLAALAELGVEPVDLGLIADDEEADSRGAHGRDRVVRRAVHQRRRQHG